MVRGVRCADLSENGIRYFSVNSLHEKIMVMSRVRAIRVRAIRVLTLIALTLIALKNMVG